ncbi:MAG: protein kinase [Planctomycetota bacterium]|jgi:serine/threonine-protein kinase|nr:protein kinase [Planctomycetota bacterium]
MADSDEQTVSLVCTKGPLRGKVFELIGGPAFVFGRCPKSHFNLSEDPSISHLHFLVDISDGRVRITDLGSTNGLKVNLSLLNGKTGAPNAFVELRHGDSILAGSSLFRLSIGGKSLHESREGVSTETIAASRFQSLQPDAQAIAALDSQTIATPKSGLKSPGRDREPPAPAAELPHIAGYTLVSRIGGGGGSVIYKAIKDDSGAIAAIKMPRPEAGETKRKRLLDTFRREIEITRLLSHPNIIRYLGNGLADGQPFLALEYIDGGNLEDLIWREAAGGMELDRAAPMFIEMLEALAHMHEARIVHRDIKPKNILLDLRRGGGLAVKLSDMGLACRFSNRADGDLFPAIPDGGTPAYMPPEQLSDLTRVIPQSDVFSAAATFYHMLTGTVPYNSTGQGQALAVLDRDIMPILDRKPDLQPEIAMLIARAMSPRPEDRQATAQELLDDFRWALS